MKTYRYGCGATCEPPDIKDLFDIGIPPFLAVFTRISPSIGGRKARESRFRIEEKPPTGTVPLYSKDVDSIPV